MRPNQRITAGVMEHRGRSKIVEIRRHRNRASPIIHDGRINGDTPSVHGAGGIVGVGYVVIFGHEPPQPRVHLTRSIGVPNFQSVLATAENPLHFNQFFRHTGPDHWLHIERVEPAMGDVVRSGVAQLDRNCRCDVANVYPLKVIRQDAVILGKCG